MSYVSAPVSTVTPDGHGTQGGFFRARRLKEVTGDGDYPGDLGGLEER